MSVSTLREISEGTEMSVSMLREISEGTEMSVSMLREVSEGIEMSILMLRETSEGIGRGRYELRFAEYASKKFSEASELRSCALALFRRDCYFT